MMKQILLALPLLVRWPSSTRRAVGPIRRPGDVRRDRSSGSGNAQTITVPNASSMNDLVGVLVKYIPAATNTTAATVTVNGFSPCTYRKPTSAGLAALNGSPAEIVTGQSLRCSCMTARSA